tara:strand:+ start:1246 stop:1410 length:165 start_codon:yes stop_codon:yes gene_type:complete
MSIKEIYKGWEIEKADYGYYEATNLNDCDAFQIFDRSVKALKLEIDEKHILYKK